MTEFITALIILVGIGILILRAKKKTKKEDIIEKPESQATVLPTPVKPK